MHCTCMGDVEPLNSLITQTELARLSGATKQAVYKARRSGYITTKKVKKRLMVVFDDDLTQLWYEKQVAKNAEAPLQPKPEGKSTAKVTLVGLQEEKTLEEIGRIRADKRLKELQLQQKRDELIPKDTVAAVLFQYLDALNINMLDVPEMIIDTVMDKVSAGASRGDIIKIMRDNIRRSIVNTKTQIKERLK